MKTLSTFGVSALHVPTGTTKLFQLKSDLGWGQVKTILTHLGRAGILTLTEAVKSRIVLRWEPRVFPDEDIKPQAAQTIPMLGYDLTLAFKSQEDREEFVCWLYEYGSLFNETQVDEP